MKKCEFHEVVYIKNQDCKSSTQKLEMTLISLLTESEIPFDLSAIFTQCFAKQKTDHS